MEGRCDEQGVDLNRTYLLSSYASQYPIGYAQAHRRVERAVLATLRTAADTTESQSPDEEVSTPTQAVRKPKQLDLISVTDNSYLKLTFYAYKKVYVEYFDGKEMFIVNLPESAAAAELFCHVECQDSIYFLEATDNHIMKMEVSSLLKFACDKSFRYRPVTVVPHQSVFFWFSHHFRTLMSIEAGSPPAIRIADRLVPILINHHPSWGKNIRILKVLRVAKLFYALVQSGFQTRLIARLSAGHSGQFQLTVVYTPQNSSMGSLMDCTETSHPGVPTRFGTAFRLNYFKGHEIVAVFLGKAKLIYSYCSDSSLAYY